MFTGIVTKILLGCLGASMIWGGFTYVKYNWWDRPRLEAKIMELEQEKVKLEIKAQAYEQTYEYLKKTNAIQRRVAREKTEEIRPVVESGSVDDLERLYRRYDPGLRGKGKSGAAAAKAGRSASDTAPGTP